jgi:hypothetical protein
MRLLYLTTVLPLSPTTGGEIVSSIYINSLIELGHSVDVLGYVRNGESEINNPPYFCVEQRTIETSKSLLDASRWYGFSILKGRAYSSQKYVGTKYREKIRTSVQSGAYDCIFIDHTQMGWALDEIPKNQRVIFISHNVEIDLYKGLADSASSMIKKMIYNRESASIAKLEKRLFDRACQTWALTIADKNRYNQLFGAKPLTTEFDVPSLMKPNSDTIPFHSFDIALIGTWTWEANKKGLVYFLNEVVPRLPKHTSIKIAGKGAAHLIPKNDNIEYVGFVESAEIFMQQAKVIAIPCVAGAGIQIKTLDAISIGRPIVASPLALRGISALPSYVKEAKNPSEFAGHLTSLLNASDDCKKEAVTWVAERNSSFLNAIDSKLRLVDLA